MSSVFRSLLQAALEFLTALLQRQVLYPFLAALLDDFRHAIQQCLCPLQPDMGYRITKFQSLTFRVTRQLPNREFVQM